MFYNQTAIDFLVNRVGWAQTIPPADFEVSSQNITSTSGRFFVGYHKLAIAENLIDVQPNFKAEIAEFNNYLFDLKKEAVLSVLSQVFDENERANYRYTYYNERVDISGIEYSSVIMSKEGLFDNAIGYQMAVKVVELILASTRKNGIERDTKFNWESLKIELEGLRNEYGKEISQGLYSKLNKSIQKVINILFPKNITPAIVGRQVW